MTGDGKMPNAAETIAEVLIPELNREQTEALIVFFADSIIEFLDAAESTPQEINERKIAEDENGIPHNRPAISELPAA